MIGRLLRGTFGLKLPEQQDAIKVGPRIVDEKRKTRDRRALKLKKAQARHMRRLAA